MLDVFEQGESIDRTLRLTDGTSAIDTATFLTIEVIARHKKLLSDAGTYSVAIGNLTKESPTSDGYVWFDIPPSVSIDLPPGDYELIVTTTETDTDYDDNVRTRRKKLDNFTIIKV